MNCEGKLVNMNKQRVKGEIISKVGQKRQHRERILREEKSEDVW